MILDCLDIKMFDETIPPCKKDKSATFYRCFWSQ